MMPGWYVMSCNAVCSLADTDLFLIRQTQWGMRGPFGLFVDGTSLSCLFLCMLVSGGLLFVVNLIEFLP